MRPISSAELVRMRNTMKSNFQSSALVERPTVSSDGLGGTTTSWSTVGTYSCRLNRSHWWPKIESVGGRTDEITPFDVVFEHGTDIREGDRLTVDGTYTLRAIRVNDKSLPLALQVIVEEFTF